MPMINASWRLRLVVVLGLLTLCLVPGAQADITSNLVAWYRLVDGTGTTAADSSGNTLTATLGTSTAAPTWVTGTCVAGKVAGCLSFDGNDTVALPVDARLNITGDLTLALWINTTVVATSLVVGGYHGTGAFEGYGMMVEAAGKLGFWAGGSWTYSSGTVNNGVWRHAAVTLAGTTVVYYIDGVVSGTATAAGAIVSWAGARALGSLAGGGGPFLTGSLKSVRFYSRALSAADISALQNEEALTATSRRKRILFMQAPRRGRESVLWAVTAW